MQARRDTDKTETEMDTDTDSETDTDRDTKNKMRRQLTSQSATQPARTLSNLVVVHKGV